MTKFHQMIQATQASSATNIGMAFCGRCGGAVNTAGLCLRNCSTRTLESPRVVWGSDDAERLRDIARNILKEADKMDGLRSLVQYE